MMADEVAPSAEALSRPMLTSEKNVSIIVFEIVCFLIGLPLNVSFICAILKRKTLHSSPRNIFVLGIAASSLSVFVQPTIEEIHYFSPSDVTCRAYLAVMGLPDCFLLINIFFSLVDRYVAFQYPLSHQSKMTVKLAVCTVVTGFLVTIGTCRFVYFAQLIPFECRISFRERSVTTWYLILLFLLSLAARVTVHLQTKRILMNQADPSAVVIYSRTEREFGCFWRFGQYKASSSSSLHQPIPEEGANQQRRNLEIQFDHQSASPETLHQLELKANKVLIAGVTSLLFFSFPLVAFMFSMFTCRTWFASFGYCNRISRIGGYVKQFTQLHAIYHPISYMAWNKDFTIIPACCCEEKVTSQQNV